LADLERRFGHITTRLHPAGGFWVAYRTHRGDIDDHVVRRIGLAAGMVENKVCAIDGSWSAMRLVLRDDIRDAVAYRAEPPALSRRVRRSAAAARVAQSRVSGAGSALRRARARGAK
jgi:hypothetical protein